MLVEKLLDLFEGDSSQFIKTSLTGEVDERGKKKASYTTVHEPITTQHWEQHTKGKTYFGLRPEKGDVCKWAAIDIDPNNYTDFSVKRIVDIIKKYNLPLVPCKSKSGGLHIFLFFTEWADKEKVIKKLRQINDEYFLSLEVFPCNKAMSMPYFNAERTMEYGMDKNGNPLMLNAFIEYAESMRIKPEDFYNYKLSEHEIENEWREYPPCVQKMISEKWSGNHRNDFLFNILVLEMKKTENAMRINDLIEVAMTRNEQAFASPLDRREVENVARSVHKNSYMYKCPPKLNAITPLCNKDLCKLRKLGIGTQVPDIKDEFKDIVYIEDTKGVIYSCTFRDKHVTFKAEDIKDEKSWRTCLARHRIFWITLPRPKRGPAPFELLMKHIVETAEEHKDLKYADTVEEQQYQTLKDFFEKTIEQDKFDKLKDGYTVVDTKTNMIYFKRITLQSFLDKQAKSPFRNVAQALKLLNCNKHEYHEGEKNVWYVEMPEFVSHQVITKKTNGKDTVTEMDDEFHSKFRAPKAGSPQTENN